MMVKLAETVSNTAGYVSNDRLVTRHRITKLPPYNLTLHTIIQICLQLRLSQLTAFIIAQHTNTTLQLSFLVYNSHMSSISSERLALLLYEWLH